MSHPLRITCSNEDILLVLGKLGPTKDYGKSYYNTETAREQFIVKSDGTVFIFALSFHLSTTRGVGFTPHFNAKRQAKKLWKLFWSLCLTQPGIELSST